MTWILTTVLCVILVEFAVRIPLPGVISEISTVAHKAMHTLGAKHVSDHWKEKVMLAYAGSLFTSTMKLAGLLVAIGAVAAVFILLSGYTGIMIGDFLASWPGILFTLVVATAYYAIRKRLA